ncbi:glycosyltransferase family 35 protein [Piptocephalis cylindrospora]|uniref:Alpha-1,4 glucan phosphorylase n=1 Tax=Piptocephalis cylindrospora TaxID=1907219 RepID=A0A4P9XZM6_9FUNG|nr:glycosyltransferase family 35 protein [Piptocephalis cylindrospora]|eukprot:RKP11877.1 glycosyltransferase family 35 protein [Piptocephalis cylindrospora]
MSSASQKAQKAGVSELSISPPKRVEASDEEGSWNPPPVTPEILALWDRDSKEDSTDKATITKSLIRHATTTLARAADTMGDLAAYHAMAHSVRDRLIKRWNDTQHHHTNLSPKRVYYLSMEFLLGRSLDNALLALRLKPVYSDAATEIGFRMEDVLESETDAALGNGGLGRLAACYLDSLATLDYPAWGYGLRYTYGIFQQKIVNGFQTEVPDYWLTFDNPWEIPRLDVRVPVRFYGSLSRVKDAKWPGGTRRVWEGGDVVEAVAYDVPIPGYRTPNCLNIRLWSSKPGHGGFDLNAFNAGDYQKAVAAQASAENITSVLYPNDNHMLGKELRLKQQYLFVRATLHDILRRFRKTGLPWAQFPDQVAIQLNDTHPTLGIAELQRVLVDEHALSWDAAWDIVTRTYAFTNHTVLPEALEKWPVPMVQHLLPRHMEIIFDINLYFLQAVERKFPGDRALLNAVSIIEESAPQQVRMAFLAVVGSHTVNGVAALHSHLIRTTIFKDFVRVFGEDKFQNKTNGITPRRWLHQANQGLSILLTEVLGSSAWVKDLGQLSRLEGRLEDSHFLEQWNQVKKANKERLAEVIYERTGVIVDPEALFDVQVKRIHEYKRQLMNILSVIHRYHDIKARGPGRRASVVPRVVIFGGKAAPGYWIAKAVIKLINNVAKVVNEDPDVGDALKVIFLPDYNVSLAEVIVPASDISQHISTAGTEASGTSNMKFVLNGGVILGTVDGANIEIAEAIGKECIFLFGLEADQVDDQRHRQRYGPQNWELDKDMARVLESIRTGEFGDPVHFTALLDGLEHGGDNYLLSADFPSYLKAQAEVDRAWEDREGWLKRSIRCTARMGGFSSDRAVEEYARDIWGVKPCRAEEGVEEED